jgi:hypothetical protein
MSVISNSGEILPLGTTSQVDGNADRIRAAAGKRYSRAYEDQCTVLELQGVPVMSVLERTSSIPQSVEEQQRFLTLTSNTDEHHLYYFDSSSAIDDSTSCLEHTSHSDNGKMPSSAESFFFARAAKKAHHRQERSRQCCDGHLTSVTA